MDQVPAASLFGRDAGVPDQVWLKSGFLPEYYQDTFHYQSDGWLSASSGERLRRLQAPTMVMLAAGLTCTSCLERS